MGSSGEILLIFYWRRENVLMDVRLIGAFSIVDIEGFNSWIERNGDRAVMANAVGND